MTTVTLNRINKSWGGFHAVKDLNLNIDEGEFLVLLGPSGCGKTTTMRMIAGLEDPTDGDLMFDAQRMNGIPPRQRDVSMVFQNYGLYPHMSVYDNIAYPLKLRGVSGQERDREVKRAAERVELGHLLARRPAALSGGQRQRVALARSIVRRPRVFLMDEPLSNLDAKLRGTMRAELKHLARELAVTTVYVTHDQVEAMTLASRVAIMKDGVLQQIDAPERIYNEPANAFVAAFIGSPAMNLLNGEGREGKFVMPDGFVLPVVPPRSGPLTLGVRPEDVLIDSGEAPGSFSADIYAFELLGDNTLITLKIGGQHFVVKGDKTIRYADGDRISLRPEPAKLFWFDGTSGQRIAAAQTR
ncbi:ABC transporter ATP-binding protein [Burkholderia pseudomultivorans]|uniref:ABC transporter ATP-binding protein n=1 Tax=Burkholderia pseudomultivorans TaxID=1207504 RepID=A0A132EAA9_9BURK|nr:ABC transporter ATP-binding protein [Burkholderia pseudomultivorans]KWF23277.1 ABC transporter ATP-binding protein [Burkholderia pseudomultivorans]